jgi:hypothetical protein
MDTAANSMTAKTVRFIVDLLAAFESVPKGGVHLACHASKVSF